MRFKAPSLKLIHSVALDTYQFGRLKTVADNLTSALGTQVDLKFDSKL